MKYPHSELFLKEASKCKLTNEIPANSMATGIEHFSSSSCAGLKLCSRNSSAVYNVLKTRGYVSGQEVFRGAKEIYERFKSSPKFPSVRLDTGDSQDVADFIDWLTKMANANLEKANIPLRLKKTFEEVKLESGNTHMQYYCLVPESQDEAISKLQRNFGEPELEWLKMVAEHLIEEEEDSLATPNTLTNLCR